MVGMGGSGRRSTAKLAASIAECKLITIQVTKTYSMTDWRDDIKKILMTAGFNKSHTVFLFSDSQVNLLLDFYVSYSLLLIDLRFLWQYHIICILDLRHFLKSG